MTNTPTTVTISPAQSRRLSYRGVRGITKPRWAAVKVNGRRTVGLLVPRPCRHDQNAVSHIVRLDDGTVFERSVGFGQFGELTQSWYSARAGELSREVQKAIRDFARTLPKPHNGNC